MPPSEKWEWTVGLGKRGGRARCNIKQSSKEAGFVSVPWRSSGGMWATPQTAWVWQTGVFIPTQGQSLATVCTWRTWISRYFLFSVQAWIVGSGRLQVSLWWWSITGVTFGSESTISRKIQRDLRELYRRVPQFPSDFLAMIIITQCHQGLMTDILHYVLSWQKVFNLHVKCKIIGIISILQERRLRPRVSKWCAGMATDGYDSPLPHMLSVLCFMSLPITPNYLVKILWLAVQRNAKFPFVEEKICLIIYSYTFLYLVNCPGHNSALIQNKTFWYWWRVSRSKLANKNIFSVSKFIF